jgi:hypothetical protein
MSRNKAKTNLVELSQEDLNEVNGGYTYSYSSSYSSTSANGNTSGSYSWSQNNNGNYSSGGYRF